MDDQKPITLNIKLFSGLNWITMEVGGRLLGGPRLHQCYGDGVQRCRLLGKPRGGNRIGIIGITTAFVARATTGSTNTPRSGDL
jgi:hypothetical protein